MSSIVDEILSRADIVEIISFYYPLKKVGKNYRMHCPFHLEKKPSFTVSPEKQIFHCFGCGVGGNVINFIMLQEKVERREAIKILAERLGIKNGIEDTRSLSLYKLLEEASRIFRKFLLSPPGKKAYEYLKKRGITPKTSEKFYLGYVPPGRAWFDELIRKEDAKDNLLKTGLALEKDGKIFPYFWNRVMFPIFNLSGKVVGFGGRTLGEGEPKYLNSPETPIFEKGKILYGLNISRGEIAKKKIAILVEGYMDLLSLYQAGIENICASLGTSFTPHQASLIRRYAEKVIVLYDSDEAGQEASLRALESLWSEGIKADVVILPSGNDPDSYLKKNGKDNLLQLLKNAQDGLDFYFSRLKEKEHGNIKRIMERCFSFWKGLKDVWVRETLIQRSSQILNIDVSILKDAWKSFQKKKWSTFTESLSLPPKPEQHLLSLFLNFPSIREKIFSELPVEKIEDPTISQIFSLLKERRNEKFFLPTFLENLGENEKKYISSLLLKDIPHSDPEKECEICLRKIKEKYTQQRIKELQEEIKRVEKGGEKERILLKKLQELLKKDMV
ncbi:DNA primase [Candidatus Calescamantes bacterium]|nr:DNA primase [Candidatus Calescamantes bacterium]